MGVYTNFTIWQQYLLLHPIIKYKIYNMTLKWTTDLLVDLTGLVILWLLNKSELIPTFV